MMCLNHALPRTLACVVICTCPACFSAALHTRMTVSAHDAAASTSDLKTSTNGHEASIISSCLACAPVTALQFLSPSNLLVAAQGPYLKLYDVYQPQKVLARTKLWSFQRIHGIVRYPHTSPNSRERFLVFGGKHAAIVHCDREEWAIFNCNSRP